VIAREDEESQGICQWNEYCSGDKWKSVEVCNCNKEDELDCDKEDKESRLVDRLRNLSIAPSDDGRMGLITKEAEELQ
jgi:hypothetical protein